MLKPIQLAKSTVVFLLSLVILTFVVTPSFAQTVSLSPTPTVDPLTAKLLIVAQSKLDAEYNVLISGDSTKLTKANLSMGGNVAQGISNVANAQLGRYTVLAAHGLHYTKFVSTLTPKKVVVANGTATLTADEYAVLHLDNGTKDPVDTKEGKMHIFHFVLQGSQWILDKDEDPFASVSITPEPNTIKVTGKPMSILGKSSVPISRNGLTDKATSNNTMMTAATSGTFNPANAVNYARNYWGYADSSGYNHAYRPFSNDCTNFVSQAMNWGGWQHVPGFYQDYHYWWYDPNGIQTYSWGGANGFYWFARYSGRATNATYWSDLRPGDVIQIMNAGNTTGNLDHTMIVSKVDSAGNIYITEHSHNNLDKPMWVIYQDNPGASFYGTVMKYSY